MRHISVAVLLCSLGSPLAKAQVGTYGPGSSVPRLTVSTGYQAIVSNAPPNVSDAFVLQGGYVSAAVTTKRWLRIAADVTGSHSSNIGPLGQDLDLITYTFGPQVVLHRKRLEPHAQILLGGAHGFNSFFPRADTYSTSASSFAFQTGGGLDLTLSQRFGVRLFEVEYLHTSFPNAVNDFQHHLMTSAGLTYRLRGRR